MRRYDKAVDAGIDANQILSALIVNRMVEKVENMGDEYAFMVATMGSGWMEQEACMTAQEWLYSELKNGLDVHLVQASQAVSNIKISLMESRDRNGLGYIIVAVKYADGHSSDLILSVRESDAVRYSCTMQKERRLADQIIQNPEFSDIDLLFVRNMESRIRQMADDIMQSEDFLKSNASMAFLPQKLVMKFKQALADEYCRLSERLGQHIPGLCRKELIVNLCNSVCGADIYNFYRISIIDGRNGLIVYRHQYTGVERAEIRKGMKEAVDAVLNSKRHGTTS